MVFRNFLTFYALANWTPTGGESQNVGFLGHFSPGGPLALREIPGPGRNQKTHFPGARGPETEQKSYHAIRDGCPQLFYTLHFGRPDPQGREIAKYGDCRPFWPGTAFGFALKEIPGTG